MQPSVDDKPSAEVYAIGTYQPSLCDSLSYRFEHIPPPAPGTSVCVLVAWAYDDEVAALASALRVDPRDVSQHHLDPAALDLEALDAYASVEPGALARLRDAGFSFHFWLRSERR